MGIDDVGRERSLGPETAGLEEGSMVGKDKWEEIRRLHREERLSVSEIGRRLDLDRKTVRRWIGQETWEPYQRAARAGTLLEEHADFLRRRAPEVNYSARILHQELVQHRGYRGSYDTVKLFVRPIREVEAQADRAQTRFETAPGHQCQIDWGLARVQFGEQRVERHIFVMTLGYSRRGFYLARRDERISSFLDSHERAFEHFGGRCREHLYDRPRTVCHPAGENRHRWNPTFRAFADYWGFEPRLCRPYRPQTKGKVESGVKYMRRNFLPGRCFLDDRDFDEQLVQWTETIADVRVHGTTHERPVDRFEIEARHLVPTREQPSSRLEARFPRIVADDYLVSLDTNRYSVPFGLIGQTVELHRCNGRIRVLHRDQIVADHPELQGKYRTRILPEHGPGAVARNSRQVRSTPEHSPIWRKPVSDEVEVRDLSVYERAAGIVAEVQP
jgi:transposase